MKCANIVTTQRTNSSALCTVNKPGPYELQDHSDDGEFRLNRVLGERYEDLGGPVLYNLDMQDIPNLPTRNLRLNP